MFKKYAEPVFARALNKLGVDPEQFLTFETPKNPEHGDLSVNAAMKLAKTLKKPPRKIAEDIIDKLDFDKSIIEKVEIAGPGFINVAFSDEFFADCARLLSEKGERIGEQNVGEGKKVNVEYVSVNPTGLLHIGHGRNAAIGDTVANFYEKLGFKVTREYYFNNAGNQMNVLAGSIYARYMQLFNENFEMPEDSYRGEYVKTIAAELREEYGDSLKSGTDENLAKIRKFGERWCFKKIEATLERMKIKQDVYFNEDSLYKDGKIDETINDLKENGLVYEKDGATWLKFTELGLADDRVIVKSSGEPTYRLPDIAYHREKFRRGFDEIIDVFGADHIATVPDVLAAVKALGCDPDKVRVLVHQFVTLLEDGEQVKMSKRSGKSYTLDDLIDEVGADVVRFFLLMRGMSTHLEFDLGLAREQSEKNPVFYLQYAHARICSIFAKAEEKGVEESVNINFALLKSNPEIGLIKKLVAFEDTVKTAGLNAEPQVLAEFLREIAQAFHVFYHECRILGEAEDIMTARLALARIVKNVIKTGLGILGVSAPEKM